MKKASYGQRYRRLPTVIGTILIVATVPGTSEAAEWRIEPLFRMAGDFNDNANLAIRTDEEDEISGFIAEAMARISYASEVTNVYIEPRLRSKRYPNDDNSDTDDQFARFDVSHNRQNNNFGFRGDFAREDIRTAELAEVDLDIEDPDDLPEDNTGNVGDSDHRIRWSVAPRWSHRLSDVSSLSADVVHIDVSYDDEQEDNLVDFTDTRFRTTYSRVLSERNTGYVSATVRYFDASDINNDNTGYGLGGGFSRSLTETTTLRALFGLENTDRQTGSSDLTYVADFSLRQQLETIRLFAQYRRRVNSNGSGGLTLRDEVNLSFNRDLSERLAAGLGVRAYNTSALDEDVESNERNYAQLAAQFTWALTEKLSLSTDYRYTFLDRKENDESANSNRVTLWLSYRPNPITRSR